MMSASPTEQSAALESAARLVEADLPPRPVVTGFDGFVDEMISLVAERHSLAEFTPVRDIGAYAELVRAAAGHSSLREIVITDVHPGGCAVNLGDGLAALGVPVDCFATLGEPPHPALAAATSRFRSAHSWGREPGRTLAFEFADGKLMYSAVRQLQEFTADEVRGRLSDGSYAAACGEAAVIALTDWTLYPHMTGVWALLLEEVFARLTHRPHFFFDLVDPSGRTEHDVREMLRLLPAFEVHGPVTLGLNGNEANILARLEGLEEAGSGDRDAVRLAVGLRGKLGISTVVIHRNKFAVAAGEHGQATVQGPHAARPRKSTGAGDRFNAGYIFGLLAAGSLPDCLVLGCATAGYFVRQAESPSRAALAGFLRSWAGGKI